MAKYVYHVHINLQKMSALLWVLGKFFVKMYSVVKFDREQR